MSQLVKRYWIPYEGTILNSNPLQGDPNDPIRVPFEKLFINKGLSAVCLEYNLNNGLCLVEITAREETHQEAKIKFQEVAIDAE